MNNLRLLTQTLAIMGALPEIHRQQPAEPHLGPDEKGTVRVDSRREAEKARRKAKDEAALREEQAREAAIREDIERQEARTSLKMRRRQRRAGVIDHGPDEDGRHYFEPAEPAAKHRQRERRAGQRARRGW